MPLYTYVIAYGGESYVVQQTRSNYKGFTDWIQELPQSFISSSAQKELSKKIHYAEFLPAPNRKHVWIKTIELDGEIFKIFAIQTTP